MISNILNSHMTSQFKNISFKSSGICPPRIGKAKIDLSDLLAIPTRHPRNPQLNEDLLSPNRQGVKDSHASTLAADVPAAADEATEAMILFCDGEENRPLLVLRTDVPLYP
jgi:hypothetical protein